MAQVALGRQGQAPDKAVPEMRKSHKGTSLLSDKEEIVPWDERNLLCS